MTVMCDTLETGAELTQSEFRANAGSLRRTPPGATGKGGTSFLNYAPKLAFKL